MRGEPLNKWERIKLVKKLGLNTEDSVNIEAIEDLDKHKEFIDRCEAFSIRTYNPNDNSLFAPTPHCPTIKKIDFYKQAALLLDSGLNLIVADQIDPKDCRLAGCARKFLDPGKNTIVDMDLAYGPCTVRKVTHDGVVDIHICFNKLASSILESSITNSPFCELKNMLHSMLEVRFNHIIFEFSFYSKPVGILKETFICWEITDDGTGLSGIDKVKV